MQKEENLRKWWTVLKRCNFPFNDVISTILCIKYKTTCIVGIFQIGTHDSYFIAVQDSGPAVDTVQLRIDSVEEQLMVDPVSYDEVGLFQTQSSWSLHNP